jgi:hypothetical protein
LTKGAGKRSADEISEAIESVGGSLFAGSGLDVMTVRANALTSNAPLAFELLGDAAARPTFPDKELELIRTQTLSGLQIEQSDPAAIASRTFARAVYGSGPYARRASPATVRALTRADVLAFQQARSPERRVAVVAGDITLLRRRPATRALSPDGPARSCRHEDDARARVATFLQSGNVGPPPRTRQFRTFAAWRPSFTDRPASAARCVRSSGQSRAAADRRAVSSFDRPRAEELRTTHTRRRRGRGGRDRAVTVAPEVTDSALAEVLVRWKRASSRADPGQRSWTRRQKLARGLIPAHHPDG